MQKDGQNHEIRKEARKILIWALAIISFSAIFSFVFFDGFSLFDAVYETVCSLTLGKCNLEYTLQSKVASLFLALSSWLVFAVLVEFVTGFVLNLEMGERKMRKKIEGMKGQIIVCGYGDLGKAACEIFKNSGEEFVVVDIVEKTGLKESGIPYVIGDALDLETLKKAGIDKAKLLVAALDKDSNNVFLVLTARELSKDVRIASRAYSEQSIGKLHEAGAEIIVMPEILGGLELAKQVLNLNENQVKSIMDEKSKFSVGRKIK